MANLLVFLGSIKKGWAKRSKKREAKLRVKIPYFIFYAKMVNFLGFRISANHKKIKNSKKKILKIFSIILALFFRISTPAVRLITSHSWPAPTRISGRSQCALLMASASISAILTRVTRFNRPPSRSTTPWLWTCMEMSMSINTFQLSLLDTGLTRLSWMCGKFSVLQNPRNTVI